MADLTIKPQAGSSNKLILQDQQGGAVLTTATSGTELASVNAQTLTPTATGSAPSASSGKLYYDSTKKALMYSDGTSWIKVGETKLPGISKTYSGSFDGTDDYISLSEGGGRNFWQTNRSHSMACWFKADTAETACLFSIDDDNGWHQNNLIYTVAGGIRSSYVAQGEICRNEYVCTYINAWHHVAMTVKHKKEDITGANTSQAWLYFDGRLVSCSGWTSTTMISGTSDKGSLGKYHITGDSHTGDMTQNSGSPGYFFEGLITEASTWNNWLSPDEITAIYNYGTPIDLATNAGSYASEAYLTGWFRTENNANDSSGNGWNGSASGTTYTNSSVPS